jgi:glucuronoarabinoxylan endo-1,4-beta-xylanase
MSVKYFCTALIFVAVLSLIPVYCENVNVLKNPDFEEGTMTGWNDRGCKISSSKDSHSGSYSGLATGRTATWQGISQSLVGKIKPGATYKMSAWVKIANVPSDNVYMTVEKADEGGNRYIRVGSAKGSNSEWVQISGDFKLDVTGKLFTLNVYLEGPASGVDLYVDDAIVFGPPAEPPKPISPKAKGLVDTDTRYQVIEGFGASGGFHEGLLVAHPKKTELYNLLFKQLNLNAYRIRNTYYMSSKYTDDTAKIIHSAEHILGHPLKIMVACWSPPAYLKSNNNVVGGTLKKNGDGNYMYDEFAKWWADSLTDFTNHNINIDYLSIQNEPDIITAYDSCKLTPNEHSDSAGYNRAFEYVYKKLHSKMGDKMPKLVVPDTMGYRNSIAYIDAITDKEHVYGYAHHLYSDGMGGYTSPEAYLAGMIDYAKKYGDKPLYQTEYSRNSNFQNADFFEDAIYTAWHIHNCLVYEGVRSYYYWDLFWGQKDRGLITLPPPTGNSDYTINPTYYAFKQFSAFTDDGWQRVKASTDSDPLKISAYISPDNEQMSIVIINTSDVSIELDLSLNDFSFTRGDIYRTSRTENCVFVEDFNRPKLFSLPAKSITTIQLTNLLL